MQYFKTKYGEIINDNNIVIPMDESSQLYTLYLQYLTNNGTVYDTDIIVNVPEEIQLINKIVEIPLWRIRAILKITGQEQQCQDAINQLSEPAKTSALYIWQYGSLINRNNETIKFLQSILKITDSQLDELFIHANDIII